MASRRSIMTLFSDPQDIRSHRERLVMAEKKIGCLPVVDEKGTVQGIVTAFDVLLRILEADRSFSWEGRPPQAPALLI